MNTVPGVPNQESGLFSACTGVEAWCCIVEKSRNEPWVSPEAERKWVYNSCMCKECEITRLESGKRQYEETRDHFRMLSLIIVSKERLG